jgi:hypothetical protein
VATTSWGGAPRGPVALWLLAAMALGQREHGEDHCTYGGLPVSAPRWDNAWFVHVPRRRGVTLRARIRFPICRRYGAGS